MRIFNLFSRKSTIFYLSWFVLGVISLIGCFTIPSYSIDQILNDVEFTDPWFAFFIFGFWGALTVFILPYFLFDMDEERYALFLKILSLSLYPLILIILSLVLPEEIKTFFNYLLFIGFIGLALVPITLFNYILECDSDPVIPSLVLIGGLIALFFVAWLLSFTYLLEILFILLFLLVIVVYSLFVPVNIIFSLVGDKDFFCFLDNVLPEKSTHYNYSHKETSTYENTVDDEANKRKEREIARENDRHYYHYKTTVENTISAPYTAPIAGVPCVDVDYVVTFHYKTPSGKTTTKRAYGRLCSRHLSTRPEVTVREAESMHSSYTGDFYE